MLEIPGFNQLIKIRWNDLTTGMIVVGGVKVNNSLPLELVSYPVLTERLIFDLAQKYHFLSSKEVVVAIANRGASPSKMSMGFRTIEKRIKTFNNFRDYLKTERVNIQRKLKLDMPENISILESSYVNREYLIKDTFNSFILKYKTENVPSLIKNLDQKIALSDILSGKLKNKFNLPDDKEIMLHLVVDYSYSMNTMDKLELVFAAVNSFYKHISECMLNVKIQLYAFSDICAPVKFPLSGKEIERKDTHYSTFMKKVLHLRNSDVINKVIVFTDGEPSDLTLAIETGEKMKKLKVDYTQIIFEVNEDLNKDIYVKFTKVAKACGGNQIIVNVYELLNLISIEMYDRYIGMMTLSSRLEEPQFKEFKIPQKLMSTKSLEDQIRDKVIKPYTFKRIERKK